MFLQNMAGLASNESNPSMDIPSLLSTNLLRRDSNTVIISAVHNISSEAGPLYSRTRNETPSFYKDLTSLRQLQYLARFAG